jgi:hypothetical protein
VLTSTVLTSEQKSRSNFRGAKRGHEHTVQKGSRRSAVRKPRSRSAGSDGDRNAELSNADKSFADRRVTGDPPCASPARRAAPTQVSVGRIRPAGPWWSSVPSPRALRTRPNKAKHAIQRREQGHQRTIQKGSDGREGAALTEPWWSSSPSPRSEGQPVIHRAQVRIEEPQCGGSVRVTPP